MFPVGETSAPPPPDWMPFLFPWLPLGFVMGSVLAVMATRKGRNPSLWFLLGFIPIVGFFAALVLASRPDAALLQRIGRLEEKLKSPHSNPPELP
jgi:hypothetical protein